MDREFENMGRNMISAALGGMYLVAHDMMLVSQEQCPVDTGTLKDSARIFLTEDSVTIGYGYGEDPNPKTGRIAADYAVPVHEILEAVHEPPTKAKFLEDPVIELSDRLGPRMGFFMKQAVMDQRGQPVTATFAQGALRVIANYGAGTGEEGLLSGVAAFGGGYVVRGDSGKFVGVHKRSRR